MSLPVRTALAIGPHPDDVELFCGGTLLRLADAGVETVVVDLTRGERATRGTPEIRADEAERAAAVLGLAKRENLELPDAGLDPWGGDDHPTSSVRRVVDAVRRYTPEFVLLPPARARHPDHEAAHHLTRRALFLAGLARFGDGPAHRPTAWACYMMRHTDRPDFVVDVSEVYGRKQEAIDQHVSQVGDPQGSTLVATSASRRALEARDRFHGALIGADYGEAFTTELTIGTRDPLALLRTPSGAPRTLFERGSP